jgi:hypothetical protein
MIFLGKKDDMSGRLAASAGLLCSMQCKAEPLSKAETLSLKLKP